MHEVLELAQRCGLDLAMLEAAPIEVGNVGS